jgi:arylsulfatase A-like enzyme
MFEGATSFQGAGLQQWNVSSGQLFMVMFADTKSFNVNLSNWTLINAQSTHAMFRNSSFGKSVDGFCRWRRFLPSTVDTSWMFWKSQCPYPDNTNVNAAQNGNFCIRCSATSNVNVPTAPPQNTPSPQASPTLPPSTIRRPNILLLMTDQQRFDTLRRVQDELAHYGNVTKIETPNLDRLSNQGAYFRNAYCQCSVCAPARATIRTGCTIERTGIQHNELITEYVKSAFFTQRVQSLKGLDQVLTQNGYVSEHYGKWHLPSPLWANVSNNDFNYSSQQFYFRDDTIDAKTKRYLTYFESQGQISRALDAGMQIDTYTKFPYRPIPLDARYGRPTGTPLDASAGFAEWQTGQAGVLGVNKLGANYTNSRFIYDTSFRALQRLKRGNKPFFLTVSFHNPHPPMVPASQHVQYYKQRQNQLFVSHNLYDDVKNADYGRIVTKEPKYGNRTNIQEWTSLYYALIAEIDGYIGRIMDSLGDAANNTLVIFTSDHGEMLGAHGMREKNTFYEEAARVPLLISFPGKISPKTQVNELVSHLDLFSTILDYAGLSQFDNSDGDSLRPFIERKSYNRDYDENIVVAEWDFRKPLPNNPSVLDRTIDERPALMIRKGDWKLMIHKLASSTKIDMMFNLKQDPFELNNVLGKNAASASVQVLETAEYLRCLLLEWMKRMDGSVGYYSLPADNFGQGRGDIEEVRLRQTWPALPFWTSHGQGLEMGPVVWNGKQFVRNEYMYLGTRTTTSVTIQSIQVTGSNSSLFQLQGIPTVLSSMQCSRIQVRFASSVKPTQPLSASIRIVQGTTTRTIPISFATTT